MLVTLIIGKCLGCGAEDAFGNVNISNDILLRGCCHCQYTEQIYLPPVEKEILYLDQFFLSHAFRKELPEFVEAAKLIADLAHDQLLVCPFSKIHEAETLLWRHPQKQSLWEFIKQSSRGHKFEPDYKIKRTQILRGFERFLSANKKPFQVKIKDAILKNINTWDNYFWIDSIIPLKNIELRRKLKDKSIEELVNIFPHWRKANTTFKENWRLVFQGAARSYLQLYSEKVDRLYRGDFRASIDSPIDAMVVESLLEWDIESIESEKRLERIIAYFKSPYFEEVPYEWISSGLLALLREKVKKGHYQNIDRAKQKLRGIFYDFQFVSTYAPYCQAMFIDNIMFNLVNDKLLNVTNMFGTKFFARRNWDAFLTFLNTLQSKKNQELEHALNLVYPSSK